VSDRIIEVTYAGTLIDLEEVGHQIGQVVEENVREYGMHLQNQVRVNATTGYHTPGRPHIPGTGPGPNRATGDYVRSISLAVAAETVDGERALVADVYTNSVQGARLEYGYIGPDSLGRLFKKSPFPHFGPAADLVGPAFQAATIDGVEAVLAAAKTGGGAGA